LCLGSVAIIAMHGKVKLGLAAKERIVQHRKERIVRGVDEKCRAVRL